MVYISRKTFQKNGVEMIKDNGKKNEKKNKKNIG